MDYEEHMVNMFALMGYRSDGLFSFAIVYRNVNIKDILALNGLQAVNLLIKFLCAHNATCGTCTVTSNLSFPGEIDVAEIL